MRAKKKGMPGLQGEAILSEAGLPAALRSDRDAEGLAKEMAIIAEIGRIIGSTMNIEEVYERFAEEVRKIIPFDRIVVNMNKPHEEMLYIVYASGVDVPGGRPGDSFPLAGTVNEEFVRTRRGRILHPADVGELAGSYPLLVATFEAGLRSLMGIPLFYRDEVIGALHFRSKKERIYTEQDLRLAEKIGVQIAGAIANAQLFAELKQTEKSLRESQERFRAIADYTVDWEMWMESDRRLLWVNPSVEKVTGYSVEECMAHPDYPLFLIHPKDRVRIAEYLQAASCGESGSDLEFRFIRKDEEVRWGFLSWQPIFDAQGHSMGHRTGVHEITKLKKMQEDIELHTRQLAALYETNIELMAELNLNALFQSIAARALELIGGVTCNFYLHNAELDLLERIVLVGPDLTGSEPNRRRGEGLTGTVWMENRPLVNNDYRLFNDRSSTDNSRPTHAVVGVPVRWREEFLGVINIIAHLPHKYTQADVGMLSLFAAQAAIAIRSARLYNKIRQTSVTDELTGLFNRRGLFQFGERELERSLRFKRPLTALMCDIDHFKRVNDTHGHASGDRVLRALADCFRQNTRGIDVAGRYGGEEFVMLLPETLISGAFQIAERLRRTVEGVSIPISRKEGGLPTGDVHVTVSIGIAAMAPEVANMSALIDRTDQALYCAKNSGRNRVVIWEETKDAGNGKADAFRGDPFPGGSPGA